MYLTFEPKNKDLVHYFFLKKLFEVSKNFFHAVLFKWDGYERSERGVILSGTNVQTVIWEMIYYPGRVDQWF